MKPFCQRSGFLFVVAHICKNYNRMNKKVQKVLTMLKPKVKALGFSKEEVKGIAAKIADKLEFDDDASEEDMESEIAEKIEDYLPMLQFAQSAANRLIDNYKKQNANDDDDDDDDELDASTKSGKKSGAKKSSNKETDEESMPAWAKALIESNKKMSDELSAIKSGKTTDARRAKLEKLLKDTGTFGKTTLKQFEKMSFNDDDDFEEFLEGVEEDLADLNQERANSGLSKLGTPPATKKDGKSKTSETDVVSDDDIKAMAKM